MSAIKQRVRFGEFIVDPAHNTVTRGDEVRQVQTRVMDVLVHLIEHNDRVVPQDELLDAHWAGRVVEESTLHRVVNQIRKALDDSARDPRYIRTVSKRGYQAIAAVEAVEPAQREAAGRTNGPVPPSAAAGPYVFVCYAHEDTEAVQAEIGWLRSQGVNAWYDDGITPGDEWSDRLARALDGCERVLFFVTPRSVASRHCRDEVQFAQKRSKPVVAVYLEPTDLPLGLELPLGAVQALSRHDLDEADYRRRLVSALRVVERVGPAGDAAIAATPARSRRMTYAAVAAVVITLAAVLFALVPREASQSEAAQPQSAAVPAPVEPTEPRISDLTSIAVLPFVNMSNDADAGFFADGLVDAVLDELARYDFFRVASRTDSFDAARVGDLRIIAERLDVAYVLEGSVQRRGDDLRFTTQLIRAADRYHVWSKIYDRPLAGSFEMQTAVAENLAQLARSKIWSDIRRQHYARFPEFRGVKREAVLGYLDAQEQYDLIQLGDGGDWDHHVELIRSAVAIDPDFALGHFEMAWAYMRRLGGRLGVEDSRREAHAAIAKALELEPHSVLGQPQLAQIQLHLDLDYAAAEATLLRGLERQPRGIWWHVNLATIAFREGREADGRRLMATAAVLDYEAEQTLFFVWQALVLAALGDHRQSLEAAEAGLNLAVSGPSRAGLLRIRAEALIQLGDAEAAKPSIAEAWQIDGRLNPEGFVGLYALTGEEARAREILAAGRERPDTAYRLAEGAIALGETGAALEWLETGVRVQDEMVLLTLRLGRQWDPLRGDPEFEALLALLESKETHTAHFVAGARR